MLKAGFGRIDITPPFGVSVQGYFEKRLADGILDPLLATAVAFDDGERRAVVISVDVIGFNQLLMEDPSSGGPGHWHRERGCVYLLYPYPSGPRPYHTRKAQYRYKRK